MGTVMIDGPHVRTYAHQEFKMAQCSGVGTCTRRHRWHRPPTDSHQWSSIGRRMKQWHVSQSERRDSRAVPYARPGLASRQADGRPHRTGGYVRGKDGTRSGRVHRTARVGGGYWRRARLGRLLIAGLEPGRHTAGHVDRRCAVQLLRACMRTYCYMRWVHTSIAWLPVQSPAAVVTVSGSYWRSAGPATRAALRWIAWHDCTSLQSVDRQIWTDWCTVLLIPAAAPASRISIHQIPCI